MNASKLLKAVLRPRSLQTNVGRSPTVSDGPSSRRSLSPDSRLPKDLASKRSSSPVKMTCMCSPTNHPGSFRCRFHRAQKQRDVVALPSSPKSKTHTRDSDILCEVNRTLPGMHPSTSRSTPVRCSRLKNMTLGSDVEEEGALTLSLDRNIMRNAEGSVSYGGTASAHRSTSHLALQTEEDLPRCTDSWRWTQVFCLSCMNCEGVCVLANCVIQLVGVDAAIQLLRVSHMIHGCSHTALTYLALSSVSLLCNRSTILLLANQALTNTKKIVFEQS
ncbi:uncharacterized protein [Physcomitrium patens]|uniref:Serine-rich protein n=1 Tax=Physcomitrium patens TaxID=3218 RepID=A0A7I4FSR3_PHYPA|nr:uncharacterized protein LOC112283242 isoform X2 [Physcomitrium patens]XP_024377481.1 uncharacterized protein LOC112283242 isoform X2 [Physcomitrium patens]|eukprot:XP_024377480.1 uncharacterized protein LOC112283242 isoform X2 [Physcomitrella patens]